MFSCKCIPGFCKTAAVCLAVTHFLLKVLAGSPSSLWLTWHWCAPEENPHASLQFRRATSETSPLLCATAAGIHRHTYDGLPSRYTWNSAQISRKGRQLFIYSDFRSASKAKSTKDLAQPILRLSDCQKYMSTPFIKRCQVLSPRPIFMNAWRGTKLCLIFGWKSAETHTMGIESTGM